MLSYLTKSPQERIQYLLETLRTDAKPLGEELVALRAERDALKEEVATLKARLAEYEGQGTQGDLDAIEV